MYKKIALMACWSTLLFASSSVAGSWVPVDKATHGKSEVDAKVGTLKISMMRVHARRQISGIFRWKDSKKGETFFYREAVSLAACRKGYGVLYAYNLSGDIPVESFNVVHDGGNLISAVFDALCDVAKAIEAGEMPNGK